VKHPTATWRDPYDYRTRKKSVPATRLTFRKSPGGFGLMRITWRRIIRVHTQAQDTAKPHEFAVLAPEFHRRRIAKDLNVTTLIPTNECRQSIERRRHFAAEDENHPLHVDVKRRNRLVRKDRCMVWGRPRR
jgi:hypothetical protein